MKLKVLLKKMEEAFYGLTAWLMTSIFYHVLTTLRGQQEPLKVCYTKVLVSMLGAQFIIFCLISLLRTLKFFGKLVQFRKPYRGKLRSPIVIKDIERSHLTIGGKLIL